MIQVPQHDCNPPVKSPDDNGISVLWILGYVIFYVVTVAIQYITRGSMTNLFWFPMVFFTAAVVYAVYKHLIRIGKLQPQTVLFSDIFRGFSHSFFSGGIFAFLTELWMTSVMMLVILFLFGSSRALETIMNGKFLEEPESYICSNFSIHLYLAFSSFCVAGLIEEALKAYLLQYVTKLYLPHTTHLKRSHIESFVWIGLCIGLGFGTMEGIRYVCYTKYEGNGWLSQLILWLIRAFVAIPFHSITGVMWGTQLARREANKQTEKTWIKMGYQQVLLHGFYDFIEMEIGLNLLCVKTPSITQVIVSVIVATTYTIFSALLARMQYKSLTHIHAEFVPDTEYQQT